MEKGERTIHKLKGKNGIIQLKETEVVIIRAQFMRKDGVRTIIPIDNIVDVKVRRANFLLAGYIQFIIKNRTAKEGFLGSINDDFSVAIYGSENRDAEIIARKVKKIIFQREKNDEKAN